MTTVRIVVTHPDWIDLPVGSSFDLPIRGGTEWFHFGHVVATRRLKRGVELTIEFGDGVALAIDRGEAS